LLQKHLVRLACIRHAASVHPEPGSNSPQKIYTLASVKVTEFTGLTKNVVSYHSSVVKVLAIWRARGPCPLQYPSSGFLQTKIPMLSFCIGTVRLQNLCLVSLTWDGYSVVNGSALGDEIGFESTGER
jgi:hypothetical protein